MVGMNRKMYVVQSGVVEPRFPLAYVKTEVINAQLTLCIYAWWNDVDYRPQWVLENEISSRTYCVIFMLIPE